MKKNEKIVLATALVVVGVVGAWSLWRKNNNYPTPTNSPTPSLIWIPENVLCQPGYTYNPHTGGCVPRGSVANKCGAIPTCVGGYTFDPKTCICVKTI